MAAARYGVAARHASLGAGGGLVRQTVGSPSPLQGGQCGTDQTDWEMGGWVDGRTVDRHQVVGADGNSLVCIAALGANHRALRCVSLIALYRSSLR